MNNRNNAIFSDTVSTDDFAYEPFGATVALSGKRKNNGEGSTKSLMLVHNYNENDTSYNVFIDDGLISISYSIYRAVKMYNLVSWDDETGWHVR